MKNSFYLCGTEQDPVLPEGPEIAVWILFNRNAEIRFADFVQIHKRKLQLTDNQLTAILRSCLGRIRNCDWRRMNMNEMTAVNQLITTNLNVNKFIEIYFNALLVVQKRYTCTTVF